jgi:predicted adenine nucleotide alpha hydrolase (AANH) superfamily ATPase
MVNLHHPSERVFMKSILLHICCGICAAWSIQKLTQDGYAVTGYFYNPNIYPEKEYYLRLDVARGVCQNFNIPLIEGGYDPVVWKNDIAGLEAEPEGGARCSVCFRMRLRRTFDTARESGIQLITTTLPISPHKDFEHIKKIGIEIAGDRFLPVNSKKEDGFKKSNDFAKDHALYRQHYCGCEYSMRR